MSAAIAIRNAVFDRLSSLSGYASVRKTPVPQLQPDRLPALSVFILGGTRTPDGDINVSVPRFSCEETVAVSVVRGFADPLILEGQVDAEVDAMLAKLLTDPTFVRQRGKVRKIPAEAWLLGEPIYWNVVEEKATKVAAGNWRMGNAGKAAPNPSNNGLVEGLFEGISRINRRWLFPQDGETYFAELRLEIIFFLREAYEPAVPDDYDILHLEARPAGHGIGTPAVIVEIDQNP